MFFVISININPVPSINTHHGVNTNCVGALTFFITAPDTIKDGSVAGALPQL